MAKPAQPSLFPEPAPPPVVPASPHPDDVRLGAALPARFFFGTSSWSFPGWYGLVYGERGTVSRFSRHGLTAYASHPLLSAVGIDRSYYAPVPEQEYAAYRDQIGRAHV